MSSVEFAELTELQRAERWDDGAQGVILACTELEVLVKLADVELPVFSCTTLHVEAALDHALR
jgi:aspartate racemase